MDTAQKAGLNLGVSDRPSGLELTRTLRGTRVPTAKGVPEVTPSAKPVEAVSLTLKHAGSTPAASMSISVCTARHCFRNVVFVEFLLELEYMQTNFLTNAGVTQLVECNLAKVDVASSSLVTR